MAPVELLFVVSTARHSFITQWNDSIYLGGLYCIKYIMKIHYTKREGRQHLRERVDHGCHRRLISGADVVKVHHALYCPSLHTPHYGLGVFAEKARCFGYRERVTDRGRNCDLFGDLELSFCFLCMHSQKKQKQILLNFHKLWRKHITFFKWYFTHLKTDKMNTNRSVKKMNDTTDMKTNRSMRPL